ncbi:MAG TPA: hypothetical protein VFD49_15505 [Candidatus Dormibacteraeota bacterium]|nr:hypothetical protein [Candidatus Dormibacteraeota bacterium]
MKQATYRRIKVSVTVDPVLLRAVDEYVAEHEELDRSKVIDQALMEWCANRQAEEMQRQFAPEPVEVEEERAVWDQIRRAAAARRLGRPR